MKKVVWISSWDRICGIADYSKALLPAVQLQAQDHYKLSVLSLDEFPDARSLAAKIARIQPDLIHVQHEYGLYGGKNPPGYWFPRLAHELRRSSEESKILATAHTVISPEYRFPLKGRGWQVPLRRVANTFLLPTLRQYWGPKTWGLMDSVIVHSRHQIPMIQAMGAKAAVEIPHFVPNAPTNAHWKPKATTDRKKVLVFGFITPEKGQDIALEAVSRLSESIELVFAGGLRRGGDEGFLNQLRNTIVKKGLRDRAKITGFVAEDQMNQYYLDADLVLVPFRETSGSGSLAHALARGAPILASDLPLNREILERVPGSLALFKANDVAECALEIQRLLDNSLERERLAQGALQYEEKFGLDQVAEAHLRSYDRVMGIRV